MQKRKFNKRILILCEGMTEYLYAKALQMELPRDVQRSVSVEISHSSQNDLRSLVQEAAKKAKNARKERNEYDGVWLFFDNDNSPHLEYAFRFITKEGFSLAYSSMCLEHWFILHFEHCGRAFQQAGEALTHLKKLWPDYDKTQTKAFYQLKGQIEVAMDRAETIRKNQDEEVALHLRNPFFTVPELVLYFEGLKRGA